MRERWILHPRTGKLVPADEYVRPEHDRGPIVVNDIADYKSIITGERISGRRQHRDHLRAHGCFEVGNENIRKHGNKDKPLPPMINDIKKTLEILRSR
jgi:hypothetical protein